MVSFSVEGIATKATPYSSLDSFTEDFGLFAYTYANSGDPSSAMRLYAYDRLVSYNEGAGCWLPATALLWPNTTGYIQFFAYAPQSVVSEVTASDGNLPTLSYTVPTSVTSQKGLLVAKPDPNNATPELPELRVPLTFHHVLTGIRFQCDPANLISSVSIANVYGSGTFSMGTSSWTPSGTRDKSYTISVAEPSPVAGLDFTDNDYTMMLLPQTLQDGAAVRVQFSDEIGSLVREYSIAGQTWRPGTQLTYVIERRRVFVLNPTFGDSSLLTTDEAWEDDEED